jgi:uncharacterized protein YybS (DUF2232 family)
VPQTVQGDMARDVAFGVAITSAIYGISVYLPIIGFFFTLFVPLPVLFYRAKLGRTPGAVVSILTLALMILLSGGISSDIWLFAELVILGFALAELFEMHLSIEKTLAYATGAVLVSGLIFLMVYGTFAGEGIVQIVSANILKTLEMTAHLYESMGVPEENLYVLSNSLDRIGYVLVRIIPSLAAVSTIFTAWAGILMARPLFRAKGLFFPEFGALNLWKAPEVLVWGVIACGLMFFIPETSLKLIGLNGIILFMMIYFLQGVAIVSYFFDKKRLPLFVRVFLYSLIALQQLVLLFTIILGLFDVWFNFRKLDKQKTEDLS